MTEPAEQRRVRFGDFTVDLQAFEIRRAGERVRVEPQVFDVLAVLLGARHRVVRKEELLDAVWRTRAVTESALTSRIKALRRALDDDGQRQRVIRTVHGRGFQFVADVVDDSADQRGDAPAVPAAAGPALHQTVRFCTARDGTRLAYAETGAGPPLVKVANWLTHIDLDLDSPVWRHWYRDLSHTHRLLRYDERGCGLSDLDVDDFSIDAWVHDLETVVDAAGLDRFPLLGISQGGAVAIAYAVRHPERVSKLVTYGAFVKGPALRLTRPEHVREARLLEELAELGWGRPDPMFRQVFTLRFLPEGPPEAWTAFDVLQARTTTKRNAARFLAAFNTIDVEDSARQVAVPTLVLHTRGDRLIPVSEGRRIAQLVPGARFMSLPSPNHLLTADEPAWPSFVDAVRSFLAE